MQNLNDINKLQQMQKMQAIQTIPNLESTTQHEPSKFRKFASIVWFFIFVSIIGYASYTIITDNIKTKKQINANAEAALNTPKMQEYRAKQARRQREIAKQKRLRELGIDGISKTLEKDDLLSQQLKKQEIAEEEEKVETPKQEDIDYDAQLAAYNARLKEVQAEEARLRAEAAAAARAEAIAREQAAAREKAEQLRLEQEQQAEEQKLLEEEQRIQAEEQDRQEAEERARLAAEKAEQERLAKIKAAQDKAAYAAKLKAKVEARKTQIKTLQTGSNNSIQAQE